jgi:hypothetical protein
MVPVRTIHPSVDPGNPFLGYTAPQWLLIVAPNDFMPAAQRLANHKSNTHMPAVAVSIQSLAAYFQGVDDPETIKKAILYANGNLGTRYVMLIGDGHWFPVRWTFWHNLVSSNAAPLIELQKKGVQACDPLGDWIASDLYYANLYHHFGVYPFAVGEFNNWDSNGNRLYNEMTWGPDDGAARNPDSVDGYPDVAVGRVPAQSLAEIEKYVDKVVQYETTARSWGFTLVYDWALDGDGPHGAWQNTLPIWQQLGDRVTYVLRIEGSSGLPSRYPKIGSSHWNQNASGQEVISAASGSCWVSYIGHGGPQQWGFSPVVTPSEVASMKTSNALPVVFVSGCQTGEFVQDPPWNTKYASVQRNPAGQQEVHGPFTFVGQGGPLGHAVGPIIKDETTNEVWGVNCAHMGCKPLPAKVPTPDAYALDPGDFGFAQTWLITNAPGGAIAYFGETVTNNATDTAAELEGWMLDEYLTESKASHTSRPVLGDIYLKAQQQTWNKHRGDLDYFSTPRLFLGIMTLFGDPSLRLPNLSNIPPGPVHSHG